MTHKENIMAILEHYFAGFKKEIIESACNRILQQRPIDKANMLYEIYMGGVNMDGEYQGCYVRFKNIEKIVDKYM